MSYIDISILRGHLVHWHINTERSAYTKFERNLNTIKTSHEFPTNWGWLHGSVSVNWVLYKVISLVKSKSFKSLFIVTNKILLSLPLFHTPVLIIISHHLTTSIDLLRACLYHPNDSTSFYLQLKACLIVHERK